MVKDQSLVWMHTYLIPKTGIPGSPSEYKAITLMINLFKVVTKLVEQEIRDFIEASIILSENKLGTVRNCQGSKEQALINKNLSLSHENKLSIM